MDFLTEPVVDFLDAEIKANEEEENERKDSWKCLRCKHALTAHTSGPTLHGRCLLCLECPQALLSEYAKRQVKHGLLP